MKISINPIWAGALVVLVLGAIVFFGYRTINQDNIHSYDEGTPEQRAALTQRFGPKGSPPPGQR